MLLNRCLLPLLLAGITIPAQAEELPERLTLGGFGTLSTSYHNQEGLEYRRTMDQHQGARANRLSFGVDSLIGAQASARASSQVDGMIQAISRQNADGDWTPSVTWAFLRLAPSESWNVRAGRLGIETQLYASSRWITYSAPAVRPQTEITSYLPSDNIDGIDMAFRLPAGNTLLGLKGFHGVIEGKAATGGVSIKSPQTRISGLFASLSIADFQARIGHGYAKGLSNGDSQQLIDALRSTGFPSAANAADQLESARRRLHFTALEASLEGNPWSFNAALLLQKAPRDAAMVPSTTSVGIIGAYRWGDFKPFAGFSRTVWRSATVSTGLPAFGPLIALNQAVEAAAPSEPRTQQTLSVGLRYDFATNVSLKFQVDRVRAKNSLTVTDSRASDSRYLDLTLFSSSVDFIF